MNRTSLAWLSSTAVTGSILIGVQYFTVPYAKADFTSLLGPGLVVLIALAVISIAVGRAPLSAAFLTCGSVLPAVVMARVAVDVAADPTSHNLWPFELVFAGILGAVAAGAAVLLGIGARAFLGRG